MLAFYTRQELPLHGLGPKPVRWCSVPLGEELNQGMAQSDVRTQHHFPGWNALQGETKNPGETKHNSGEDDQTSHLPMMNFSKPCPSYCIARL